MTGNLGATEYQNIFEIIMYMIISSLSIYVLKNAPQIMGPIQGVYRMFRKCQGIIMNGENSPGVNGEGGINVFLFWVFIYCILFVINAGGISSTYMCYRIEGRDVGKMENFIREFWNFIWDFVCIFILLWCKIKCFIIFFCFFNTPGLHHHGHPDPPLWYLVCTLFQLVHLCSSWQPSPSLVYGLRSVTPSWQFHLCARHG